MAVFQQERNEWYMIYLSHLILLTEMLRLN